MAFIASPKSELATFEYITGDMFSNMSINQDRYYYLWELAQENSLKVALRNPVTEKWTKWVEFPGKLWETRKGMYGDITGNLSAAIDVHRSMLPNEIIIESDYPTYEENYEAARIIGKIVEKLGFTPLYYYSGNKSLHIHILFSWDCLKELDPIIQDSLRLKFRDSKLRFQKKFMEWLRTKMIHCWDTHAKQFDKDLIKGTHLIRCELSKNKIGYKTFLGYSYKDLSPIPYVCNESNMIYPRLGELRLSSPHDIESLIGDFIEDITAKTKIAKAIRKNKTLGDWGVPKMNKVRPMVDKLFNANLDSHQDGRKRILFILINEFKNIYGIDKARELCMSWNAKMDFPMRDADIEYRLAKKTYNLSNKYIDSFMEELGIK